MKKLFGLITWLGLVALTIGMFLVVLAYGTNLLPSNWSPRTVLDLREPMTPVSWYKLKQAKYSKSACVRVLENSGVAFKALPDFEDPADARCGIKRRVQISRLPEAKIGPLQMDCALALELVLWDQNVVQNEARRFYNQGVSSYQNLGTYNCREMRTTSGASGRMSKHATGRALDISGFTFENGKRASLIKDWDNSEFSGFFERVNKGACRYFDIVLGPNYNALHANHFHLDLGTWKTCK